MHQHRSSWEKHWLPSLNGILRPHPCCESCGMVKNISSDRAKSIGYYFNVLADVKRYLEKKGCKFSDAQLRLIYKELNSVEDFSDAYCMLGSVQRSIFINAVRKYTNLSPSFVESFL